jgi:hypothetical protein
MRRLAVTSFLVAALAQAGCNGVPNDQGLNALMRVQNAQYFPGAMPSAQDGPMIDSFFNSSGLIRPGLKSKPLSGLVPRLTTGVALTLDGDQGFWVIAPGALDPTTLSDLSWSASLSFSPVLPEGKYTLIGRAVDRDGHFGPPAMADLSTHSTTPTGTLVVSLDWQEQADLDLHVVTPDGVEIWNKNINSYAPTPGQTPDPDAWKTGGILDFDSNANCIIDGRREENVYWTVPPPSGHYLVRVDTPSLCAEFQATWTVTATLNGAQIGQSHGISLDAATRDPHQAGSGVLALEFDVP